ncbi:1-acyl-sn-glycerol-3-phosphate acyltransferase [Streptomyces hainanensis]|uniref:1-acyl-sn-glycerol-3-phosphate acyltransferase n=2 Tax=Streptomyces hainanensis TaxID=402648 RepID=A0A4R4T197_9ACTN|nr:1-acyl-sn-glycerol-3-phosphate acyltransferase [Streptomyces hainanensis]
MHSGWRPRALGTWRVPAAGPVILAGNHAHNVDGPLIMATSPRPVRFLVKKEAFVGPVATYLRAIGQLRVDRDGTDRAAVGEALAVLADGGVLGIFPEGSRGEGDFAALRAGLAYFALRSAAPIVPVAVLGSNEARGRLIPGFPPLRRRIDVVYGDPFTPAAAGGRRTRAALDEATLAIQERLAAHLKEARRLTGR